MQTLLNMSRGIGSQDTPARLSGTGSSGLLRRRRRGAPADGPRRYPTLSTRRASPGFESRPLFFLPLCHGALHHCENPSDSRAGPWGSSILSDAFIKENASRRKAALLSVILWAAERWVFRWKAFAMVLPAAGLVLGCCVWESKRRRLPYRPRALGKACRRS